MAALSVSTLLLCAVSLLVVLLTCDEARGLATPSCYDGQLQFTNTSSGSTPAGAFYIEGRVETCINGTYGAICDEGWDQLDAQVACRVFGYDSTSYESEALNGTSLDPWYGPVFLENVMCNGTETFGYQCATPGAGVITNPECYYPNRTAGVRCTMITLCANLSSPANGQVAVEANTFDSQANYSCSVGYTLNGNTTRVCQADGQWSGSEPTCEATPCANLTSPDDGMVTYDDNTVGSQANYSCSEGYTLNGTTTRVCQADGQWSGSEPICEDDVTPIQVGLEQDSYSVGEEISDSDLALLVCANVSTDVESRFTVMIALQSGTALAGLDFQSTMETLTFLPGMGNQRHCTCVQILQDSDNDDNEQFSAVLSTTSPNVMIIRDTASVTIVDDDEAIPCGNLTSPDNGTVTVDGNTVGSQANYSCSLGNMILNGTTTRVCQADGQWSGSEPTCEVALCASLSSPVNGQVTLDDNTFDSQANYSCSEGYTLNGSPTRVCQSDGQWSGSEPTCEAVPCGNLTSPDNGTVALDGSTFGSQANYSCSEGYILNGTTTRVCQADGQWSGSEPICRDFRLRWIDRTPYVEQDTVTASLTIGVEYQSVQCQVTDILVENCSSGNVTFTNLPSRRRPFNFTVVGTGPDGEIVTIYRLFRVDTTTDCWLHLINDGVTITGDTVTAMWQGTGPGLANRFLCRVDGGPSTFQECRASNPNGYSQSGLAPGSHRLIIRPNGRLCTQRVLTRTFNFEIL